MGHRIAERRWILGYNQSQLGRAVGVTFQQIQKYERGSNRVSASRLWMMAAFLQVDIGYFFEGLENDAEPLPELPLEIPLNRLTAEITRRAPILPIPLQRAFLDLLQQFPKR